MTDDMDAYAYAEHTEDMHADADESELKTGHVTTDGTQTFRAIYDETLRWNGWIAAPRFERSEVERMPAWAAEGHTFTWDGDVLLLGTNDYADEPGYAPERIEPNDDGTYCVGGFAWTWYEVDRPTHATCGTTMRPTRPDDIPAGMDDADDYPWCCDRCGNLVRG